MTAPLGSSGQNVGVRFSVSGNIATITLDHPERLNALSQNAAKAMIDALDAYESDDDVRVVVLTAAGRRAFCAGVDLKEAADNPDSDMIGPVGLAVQTFERLWSFGKPTIAALNGWTMGAGMELALACDLRIAIDHARFGMPEGKRGMGANFGSNLLARAIPRSIAFQILYLGEDFSAQCALEWGIVNWVVSAEKFEPKVAEIAGQIATRAPLSLRRFKFVLNRLSDALLTAALRSPVPNDPYYSEDRREGAAAFRDKREPRWAAR